MSREARAPLVSSLLRTKASLLTPANTTPFTTHFSRRSFVGHALLVLKPGKPEDDVVYSEKIFKGKQVSHVTVSRRWRLKEIVLCRI